MKIFYKPSLLSILLILFMSSCVSFKHEWNTSSQKVKNDDVNALLKKAKSMELTSSTSEEVIAVIDCYLKVEKIDPSNYFALWKIGNYHMLMGAAHSTSVKIKKYHYQEAIKYCEKAMYTNINFKNKISNDIEVADACEVLTINEIDAMGFWYTARFYYFKECLKPLVKVLNTRIVMENNRVINCIDSLDPNWQGGGNYFSRALYYIATPKRFGGSIEKAKKEFSTATKVGPGFLVNRWGRAKYLYSLTGNLEGFKSDMNWVINQDPHKGGNPYAWNVYFQNDAKELLKMKKK
jgi:tetratricopeptide (TPR) repeat protein